MNKIYSVEAVVIVDDNKDIREQIKSYIRDMTIGDSEGNTIMRVYGKNSRLPYGWHMDSCPYGSDGNITIEDVLSKTNAVYEIEEAIAKSKHQLGPHFAEKITKIIEEFKNS